MVLASCSSAKSVAQEPEESPPDPKPSAAAFVRRVQNLAHQQRLELLRGFARSCRDRWPRRRARPRGQRDNPDIPAGFTELT